MNNQQPPPTQPPMFTTNLSATTQAAVAQRGTPSTLNLDDIFGDVMFTPDGDTVFLSEEQDALTSGEHHVTTQASKLVTHGEQQQHAIPIQRGGGYYTTQLHDSSKPARTMGTMVAGVTKSTPAVPYKEAPQQRHHIQYASMSKKKSSRSSERKMSEQQKNERRERNREHAKRSRIRKKFLLESLQQSVAMLKDENEKLRDSIRQHVGEEQAEALLEQKMDQNGDMRLTTSSQGAASKVLDDPDFSFIKALQTAQQNFVVTDPSLPDNPIVYASQGFLNLTGYSLDQILGRNCRFLQGPETDPKTVERIRNAIEHGDDLSVCLLNYRVDGTTFWNQFFIAALRDAAGNITNFVGVQCKVSDQYAASVIKEQQKEEEERAQAATEAAAEQHQQPPPQMQHDTTQAMQ
eukprot:CAMPEP_0116147470 /NCGR_PEP_ID=MMETSP0329-20121206/17770_1 /TAXON_ID=697910 /ORGANISM="Pseudo-nitzschia arenysensis, Strain B593" /LENGTH=405 /DNA_ID=CAMNT_0003643397 /DNA_START=365 /DNA_END=1582 /DNA_ORIENTATION=-